MAQIKNVTELDFDQIKTNLKIFLSSQDKFNDYDFDGSGMNVLLDVLSYNTQYNALLAHMAMNETFLDSAQVRSNAVSHAKNLGYTPRSKKSAQAKLKVTVTGDSESAPTISIPKGFNFTGQVGSVTNTFVTNAAFNATKNSFNNQYVFDEVEAYEGKLISLTFRVDNKDEFQKFRIADPSIDTATLLVRVRSSLTSNDYVTYSHYNNLLDVKSDSKIYFLQENGNSQYEFYFGDGVLGYQPTTGQIVEITYISTNGLEGNGCKLFSSNSSVGGLTSILVELADGFTKTLTGAEKETLDSIKYNAPKLFSAQNRAVTSQDYRSILLSEYDFIEDISIWGGEVNDPPIYGKVFISIKPNDADFLTDSTKESIKTFLRNKNVGSVTNDITDPDYTFLTINAFFKYDPNETSRTKTQLEEVVRQVIVNYNNTTLEKFDGVFRQSNILRLIDSADQGILNSALRIRMHKHLTPQTGITTDYTLKFSSPIYISDSTEETLSTSNFTVNGIECNLGDALIGDGTNNRTIFLRSATTGDTLLSNIGFIYPEKGLVEINSLKIDSIETVLFFADPDSYDIAPKFNQLVSIETDGTPGISVTGEEDTIAVLGSAGAPDYTVFSRHE